ncbi:BfmA/BtgA family mobilization protein [Leeuwenhoekiella sp. A16]|uniref:BfmA/BtgA family mobilization protein n=1 Tax=unclassified Leeuwenhoekiella TaxID=2615029 RepID=UPI000C5A320D|nr:hypothetical protein [Cytophagaceae bacterium]
MDKGYEKERFEKLGIKASVAEKFRDFCKKMSKSQSMTLLLMVEFFEDNGISPAESMGPRMETLESKISTLIKKRMNGMIAIMKDIEKSQTKPTVAMLYSFFEQTEPPKKKLILEKKYVEKTETGFQEKSFTSKNKDGEWKR